MKATISILTGVALAALGWHAGAAPIAAADIVADWTQTGDPRDGYAGSWNLSGAAVRSPDRGAIISDFTTSGDFIFSGSFQTSHGDDDIIGFTWGWQDSSNHYRLGWDAFDYNNEWYDSLGTNGIDNHPTSTGVRGIRVLEEVSGVNTYHSQQGASPTGWSRNTTYDFVVSLTGSLFQVMLSQAGSFILNTGFTDSSFPTGRIGLYTNSQADVFFSNIDYTKPGSSTSASVPAPATLALLGLGLVALGYRKGNRFRTECDQGKSESGNALLYGKPV